MPLQDVIHWIAENRVHEALVRCWLHFRTDHPGFMAAEKSALEAGEAYGDFKTKLEALVLENQALKLKNLSLDFPLALLEVLDRYLFERFNLRGKAPPTRIDIDGTGYHVHRREIAYREPPRHTRQTGHLQSWMTHHWILPCEIEGIEIRIRPASKAHLPLSKAQTGKGLKVYFSHFPDGVCPAWYERRPGAVVADVLIDPKRRWESIESGLDEAAKAGADWVVFPELTVCPELRRRVSNRLEERPDTPFSLVLPGSFHERCRDKIYNTAELMSGNGRTILSHAKLTTIAPQDKREGIDPGDRINLLDTPIGLVGIPICLDFCQEGRPFGRIWEEIGAEWLLVPAFGDEKSVHAHERRAEAVCRAHNTVCVVANQNPAGNDEDRGFVCAPGGKTPGQPGSGTCVAVPFMRKA